MRNMKKSKLFFTFVAVVAMILTTSLSAFATPSKQSSSMTQLIFSEPVKLSDEEIAEMRQNEISAEEANASTNTFSTQALFADTNVFYEFENLYTGYSITSTNSLTRSSAGSVSLTLVQWPSGGAGQATISYRLKNGSWMSPVIRVSGNYTHTNKTITWTNIPAGEYWVQIANDPDGPDVDGNGYTR